MSEKNIQKARLPFLAMQYKRKSQTFKTLEMKKLFFVLALGSFVACNSGTSTENKVDSAADAKKDMIDSSASAKKDMIDSSASAQKAMVDSSAKMKDSVATKK